MSNMVRIENIKLISYGEVNPMGVVFTKEAAEKAVEEIVERIEDRGGIFGGILPDNQMTTHVSESEPVVNDDGVFVDILVMKYFADRVKELLECDDMCLAPRGIARGMKHVDRSDLSKGYELDGFVPLTYDIMKVGQYGETE